MVHTVTYDTRITHYCIYFLSPPSPLSPLSLFLSAVGERKQSFQFVVHTESAWNKRNNYVIAAQTNVEMKEWVTAFKVHTHTHTLPI